MEDKDIKSLANKAYAKKAYILQNELDNIEKYIWNNIKSEVRNKSTFGQHASLVRICFDIDSICVKVFDSGYDLYEAETIKFTHDQLLELMS